MDTLCIQLHAAEFQIHWIRISHLGIQQYPDSIRICTPRIAASSIGLDPMAAGELGPAGWQHLLGLRSACAHIYEKQGTDGRTATDDALKTHGPSGPCTGSCNCDPMLGQSPGPAEYRGLSRRASHSSDNDHVQQQQPELPELFFGGRVS